jgi:putative lipoprotein (rSAM/lipoprotein system)
MKAKILPRVNAFLAFLLSALGFTSCNYMAKYGCPHATFEAEGTITDKASCPIKDIRVQVRDKRGNSRFPETYTDENGKYRVGEYEVFPMDSVDIIVTDTAGNYASDSVRVKVEYDKSNVPKGDDWNEGAGSVTADFVLTR